MPLIDPALKEMLVCPQCHGPLEEDEAASKLRCVEEGLLFPVQDGIPIMLLEEAATTGETDQTKTEAVES